MAGGGFGGGSWGGGPWGGASSESGGLGNSLVLINRNPEPFEADVLADTHIRLDIINTAAGAVDVTNTTITIGGVLAFDGNAGGFQAGFDGPDSAQTSIGVNGDTERWVFDLTTDLASLQEVEVCVNSQNVVATVFLIDECYTFTVEDLTPPLITEVVAVDPKCVLVTFNEDVNDTALILENYSIDAVFDPALLTCVASVEAVSVERESSNQVTICTDIEMSFWKPYELSASDVEDLNENPLAATVVPFTGFDPSFPENREFDLWTMLPRVNRERDITGDLQRWICILQENTDQILYLVDQFSKIYDPDVSEEQYLNKMLTDLGNPFAGFILSEVDKRRLIRVLVQIYKQKGLKRGIVNVARFFLRIEIEVYPYTGDDDIWDLGLGELGIDTILGTSTQADLYSFVVESPVLLTDEERRRLLQIIDYMKPAHTHLRRLDEPFPPETYDHWELGFSELSDTTLLH